MPFHFHFEYSVGHVDESVGRVDDYVGRVCGVGSGVCFSMVIKSIGEVVLLVMFVPVGVEYKGGRLIEIFWRPKS